MRQPLPDDRKKRILDELHRDRESRRRGYREQALRILPHICAGCGREFAGKRLRELTVHHKDHNWKNNPPDGGNWELLCLYCHDHEHEKYKLGDHLDGAPGLARREPPPSDFQPFAGLDNILGG